MPYGPGLEAKAEYDASTGKTGEKPVRGPDGRFVDGNPAAPGPGRPKGSLSLKTLLTEALQANDEEKAKELVADTIMLAREGNAAALKTVWERIDGAVAQKIEIANPETYAAFVRHMKAHGIAEDVIAAVVDAVCDEIEPDGDGTAS